MTTRFSATALDLSRVDRASLWPDRSFEAIRTARLADLKARYARAGIDWDMEGIEADAGPLLHESSGYRELLKQEEMDDREARNLLAFAYGLWLDRLGDQVGTARLPKAGVASPRPYTTNPEDWESDDDYRVSIQLAPEAFASAGTLGGYIYWAKQGGGDAVRDVGVTVINPRTADVTVEVAILSKLGDGTPAPELMQAVRDRLFAADVKLLTVALTVRPAKLLTYDYQPTLCYRRGPDPDLLKAAARTAVLARANSYKRLGGDVPVNALDAAAYVGGVERVLPDPALPATIQTLRFQAAQLGALDFTMQVLRD